VWVMRIFWFVKMLDIFIKLGGFCVYKICFVINVFVEYN